ncbi:metallophosphoesterase family protein [Prosthecomicrobium sp. N25]|uniref:metallophosphoesterase family protein n=1 Tax=Prosthecomicrobium sp. N25 TaxID=3129254 RepID=UPI003076C181
MAYPPAPAGRVLYAIGDVHGRSDALDLAFARLDADRATLEGEEPIEIYVGDYIDRGPDSRGVVERLIRRAETVDCVFLRGNHEATLIEALGEDALFGDWLDMGAVPTILSYGVEPWMVQAGSQNAADLARAFKALLPQSHFRFLGATHSWARFGSYVFVHAGLKPGVPLEAQRPDDLFWIRSEFLKSNHDFGHIVVHGHTPVNAVDFRANRINIDTGAYATNRLTVLRIDEAGPRVLD